MNGVRTTCSNRSTSRRECAGDVANNDDTGTTTSRSRYETRTRRIHTTATATAAIGCTVCCRSGRGLPITSTT